MKLGLLGALTAALIMPAMTGSSHAGEADVVAVEVTSEGNGLFRFDVTVAHEDTGWEHYADSFEIVAPDGTVLGTRVLAHPHVNEQPFTRSLSGIEIADDLTVVTVRAHDNKHGLGGTTREVELPR